MGVYINPGNQDFAEIADSDYVDMTGMISLINQRIRTKNKLICISRPRRFGKSWAARMLAAYYDCSCDSHALFDGRMIAQTEDYGKYLNQFHVVYLDISGFISAACRNGDSLTDVPRRIILTLQKELDELICPLVNQPDADLVSGQDAGRSFLSLEEQMIRYVEATGGRQFIFIIDEWDAIIREARGDEEAQRRYLNLLRSWFKNGNFTSKAVAAAYMTGILPIRKDGSQSAVSDFKEYSMLYPGAFAGYTGFSEHEVASLCRQHSMDFSAVKTWYDGYELGGLFSVYNPYSVMNALEEGSCRSFWGKTSAAEGLSAYIRMDYDGLQEDVASLITGARIHVNTSGFQNDLEHFRNKDDILTLLVHLGYLTWDNSDETVHIPNQEVREEFLNFLKEDHVGEQWTRLIKRSRKLLRDTVSGDEAAVAAALDEIRGEQYAPQYYNNEQSLRSIIKYAYLSAVGQYVKIEEMPSGKGLADVVFLPAPYSNLPAMVIELKWNRSSGDAISQIKDKNYTAVLKPFRGNILLVGIDYDEKTGKHSCRIERD